MLAISRRMTRLVHSRCRQRGSQVERNGLGETRKEGGGAEGKRRSNDDSCCQSYYHAVVSSMFAVMRLMMEEGESRLMRDEAGVEKGMMRAVEGISRHKQGRV